jgi:hypothetical protein
MTAVSTATQPAGAELQRPYADAAMLAMHARGRWGHRCSALAVWGSGVRVPSAPQCGRTRTASSAGVDKGLASEPALFRGLAVAVRKHGIAPPGSDPASLSAPRRGHVGRAGVVMLRRSGPVDVDRTCVVREGFSQGVRDVPAALACSACRARPGGRPVGSGAATGRLLWACARCQTCRTTTRRWSRTSTARSLSCTTTSATPPNCRAKRRVAAHCRGLGRVGVAAKAFSDVDHGLRGSCSGLYCRG